MTAVTEPMVEIIAKVICKSGKFECGQGCCAPICMENLGDARSKCSRCTQVHGKLAGQITDALTASTASAVEREQERIGRLIASRSYVDWMCMTGGLALRKQTELIDAVLNDTSARQPATGAKP